MIASDDNIWLRQIDGATTVIIADIGIELAR